MSPFGAVRQTFSSARANRNFRLFLMGQFVSAIGTWMTFTATGWLVWQLTRSGAALGINAALQFGPMLVIGAFGGVLADRFDKRRDPDRHAEPVRGGLGRARGARRDRRDRPVDGLHAVGRLRLYHRDRQPLASELLRRDGR